MPHKVTFFQRKPRALGNFSLEIYFDTVRSQLPSTLQPEVRVSKYESNGLLPRLYNVVEAYFKQGDINHVTGDVHFLNILLKRKKSILTVLDCGMLVNVTGLKFRFFKYFWFTLPAKKASYITTISTATKQELLKHINFDPEKIIVVPVPLPSHFKASRKAFNKAQPRILQLGTASNKNINRLALALNGIPCQLVIIGKMNEELSGVLKENNIDHIVYDKALSNEEIFEEYNKADIVSFISTYEGFGMPIIEGNAVGRVVITGNVTSMPEVAGNAAHLADPFSVEDMRSGFLKIINDDVYREQLIENGFENCKRFSKEAVTNQFYEIYQKIISNN